MNPIQSLTDQQLLNLHHSPTHLDGELRQEIIAEIRLRQLDIAQVETSVSPEGLSLQEKLLYLFPIMGITMIFAAKYKGRGETRKYKQAWRIMLLSQVILFGCIILYFILNPSPVYDI